MSNQAHRTFITEKTLCEQPSRAKNEISPIPWDLTAVSLQQGVCKGCCAVSTPLPAAGKTIKRKEVVSPRTKCPCECLRKINMRVVFPQTSGV